MGWVSVKQKKGQGMLEEMLGDGRRKSRIPERRGGEIGLVSWGWGMSGFLVRLMCCFEDIYIYG